jgi:hypothetical protein
MSPAKLSAGRDRVKGVDLFLLENDICIYDGVCCARVLCFSPKNTIMDYLRKQKYWYKSFFTWMHQAKYSLHDES